MKEKPDHAAEDASPVNPWPDRIFFGCCVVIIILAGAMLLSGLFDYLDNLLP